MNCKCVANRNHDFPKTRIVQKGTCAFLRQFMRQSLNQQKLFPGNKNPRFGDIRQNDPRQMATFCNHGLVFANRCFTNFTPYMLSRKCLQKSSANYLVPRVFAQKGFAISIFGHFFCPFPENFIESCRVKTKNNNFKLQDLL